MKTNLVLSVAALLAVVACSKKTPEADQTNITSGTQDPTTQVQPTTPDMAAAPNADSMKDGGHVNAAWNAKDGGHVDSFGAGYGHDTAATGADTLPSGIGTPIENTKSTTTTTTTTTQPMNKPAKPPVDNNKVHGNGTTPGTTGGLNNGQGGSR